MHVGVCVGVSSNMTWYGSQEMQIKMKDDNMLIVIRTLPMFNAGIGMERVWICTATSPFNCDITIMVSVNNLCQQMPILVIF